MTFVDEFVVQGVQMEPSGHVAVTDGTARYSRAVGAEVILVGADADLNAHSTLHIRDEAARCLIALWLARLQQQGKQRPLRVQIAIGILPEEGTNE